MIKIAPPSKGRFLPSTIISIYKLFMAASLLECNKVNKRRIYRLMQICGLEAVIRRRRKKYPKVKPDYMDENVLAREFTAEKPNQKWCTDVTEFKYGNGKKAYLSAIIDLYDKSIVSYILGHSNKNDLVDRKTRNTIIKSK